MSVNEFLRNPVKDVVFDPMRGLNRHTFVFLGDVIKRVYIACDSYRNVAAHRAGYDKLLREFYGDNFKSKLGLDIIDYSHAYLRRPDEIGAFFGQEEVGGGDDFDDSDIEELLNVSTAPARASSSEFIDFVPGIDYITDIHVYPEDKFSELKEKIYLATDIPTYRQHIFYIDKNKIESTYDLYAEGIYNIDIRTLPQFTNNV